MDDYDKESLAFLKKWFKKHKEMPSIREFGEGLGIKSTAAKSRIDRLVKKGLIKRKPFEPRGLSF